MMNKAGGEGIGAGRGKVWLREPAASIFLLGKKRKKRENVSRESADSKKI